LTFWRTCSNIFLYFLSFIWYFKILYAVFLIVSYKLLNFTCLCSTIYSGCFSQSSIDHLLNFVNLLWSLFIKFLILITFLWVLKFPPGCLYFFSTCLISVSIYLLYSWTTFAIILNVYQWTAIPEVPVDLTVRLSLFILFCFCSCCLVF
jgi:hypothetical protein